MKQIRQKSWNLLIAGIMAVTVLSIPLIAAATPAEIWELWTAVHISPSDPYQLRHQELEKSLQRLVERSGDALKLEVVGQSAEGRNLNLLRWGKGKTSILLWSQMHGDEPTATAALLDILSLLVNQPQHPLVKQMQERLQLLIMPMLNPDGADRTRRRNAQGIDINRDALTLTTPEGRVLKAVRDRFQPEIGFNLHNQNPRTSVGDTARPVVISLLAVPYDQQGNDNPGRIRSKKICSLIYQTLGAYCYTHIARYDDSFNVRAFGDQMSAWGTHTVLIESGWPGLGGEDYLVRLNFLALLTVLQAIADDTLESANPAVYDALRQNESGLIFDWILRGATLVSGNKIAAYATDIALNFSDRFDEQKRRRQSAAVAEVGDLSGFGANRWFAAGNWVVSPSDLATGPPQGEILPGSRDLYVYRKLDPGAGLEIANLELIGVLRQGVLDDKGMK